MTFECFASPRKTGLLWLACYGQLFYYPIALAIGLEELVTTVNLLIRTRTADLQWYPGQTSPDNLLSDRWPLSCLHICVGLLLYLWRTMWPPSEIVGLILLSHDMSAGIWLATSSSNDYYKSEIQSWTKSRPDIARTLFITHHGNGNRRTSTVPWHTNLHMKMHDNSTFRISDKGHKLVTRITKYRYVLAPTLLVWNRKILSSWITQSLHRLRTTFIWCRPILSKIFESSSEHIEASLTSAVPCKFQS